MYGLVGKLFLTGAEEDELPELPCKLMVTVLSVCNTWPGLESACEEEEEDEDEMDDDEADDEITGGAPNGKGMSKAVISADVLEPEAVAVVSEVTVIVSILSSGNVSEP